MGSYAASLGWLALLTFFLVASSDPQPLYMLITPSIIRVDSEETIIVEAHNHASPFSVQIRVLDFPRKDSLLFTTEARLNPKDGLVAAKIKVPAMKKVWYGNQYVSIEATNSLFTLEAIVLLSFHNGYIFIQTDKTIYTPGSIVRYRLFTVGHMLDPQRKPVGIAIVNPDGMVVEHSLETSLDGIITQSYRIPDIVVFLFGENVEGQAFALFGVKKGDTRKSIPESLSKVPIQYGKGRASLTRVVLQKRFPNLDELVGFSIYVSVTVLTKTVVNPDGSPAAEIPVISVSPAGSKGISQADGMAYLVVNTPPRASQISVEILNKGKVFKAGRQPRKAGQNPVTFDLPVTPELIPSFRIVAYYKIGYNEIVADSIWVDVKDTCMGKLKVTSASEKVNQVHKPGDYIQLKVSGDPGAKVGLVAVDKAVYVLNKKFKLSQSKIYRKCCEDGMQENPMGYSCERRARYVLEVPECIKAFKDCCNHIFGSPQTSLETQTQSTVKEHSSHESSRTDSHKHQGGGILLTQSFSVKQPIRVSSTVQLQESSGGQENLDEDEGDWDWDEDEEELEIRSNFAESWLWQKETLPINTDVNGISSKVIRTFLKDSITTWEVLAIGLSPTKGICVADPYEIMVKKDFFIDLRLPYSIVRNEQVEIRAVVHNYGPWTLTVRVELVYNEKICSSSTPTKPSRHQFTLMHGTSEAVTYKIIPLELGEVEIEVKAVVRGLSLSDAVRKKLRVVVSDGKCKEGVVHLQTAFGDIVAETIENSIDGANLKDLIQVPSGCGEQNMIGLTPTVIATQYLDKTNQWERVGLERRSEAINLIRKERFILRLTAYVVKIFAMTARLIRIDERQLCKALEWLINTKQESNGAFREEAPVMQREMMGGSQSSDPEASLTAFVVIAMHEAKDLCQNHVWVSGGRRTHWPHPSSNLHSIEATSYGLLALIQLNRLDIASPIVQWLIEQRFYGGGYGSTQATVMVFQALTQYQASVSENKDEFLDVSIKMPLRNDWIRWRINYENSMVSRTEQNTATTGFTVSAKGTGKGTLSVMRMYYTPLSEEMFPCNKFDVTVTVEKSSHDDERHDSQPFPNSFPAKKSEGALASMDIQICIRFLDEVDATMTIVDISMLTGFSPDMDDLKKLTNSVDKYISKYEMNDVLSDKSSLILYLDKVSKTEHECLKFRLHQYFQVGLIQPGTVTVYEYYTTENRCTKLYHAVKEEDTLNRVCQEGICRCMEGMDIAVQGKTRQFISAVRCKETLSLKVNSEYLIWGPRSDMWDIQKEMTYVLTSHSWIELWPNTEECKQANFQVFCQDLQNFVDQLMEAGCMQ
ncbi:hypothetical protein JD844_010257 [Phrynosoma platyrhinos]|uniref:Complement C3 n=1 Tax=Phrynosoma platyrhinos TaxID=52577 RepID=A0ABQ7TH26_PHRPL|nr:hypothetical protein JD844_010257 [Phrynosoma platyrhinos]